MFVENPLNSSELVFPILECIHIVGFAFSVGTIALIDLRVLGVGKRYETPSQLYRDTWIWTLAGIITMIFSGLLLFSSDPDMYYLNWAFRIKMACLVVAIIFNYTVHRNAVLSDKPRAGAKAVASVSLALWSAVIFGGIFIAFIDQPGS